MQNPVVRNAHENVGDVGADISLPTNKTISKTTISRSSKLRSKGNRTKEKELINHGLQRLVSSINTANRTPSKNPLRESKRQQSRVQIDQPIEAETEPDLERQSSSHINVSKRISIDKYTMTDFEREDKKLDLDDSVLTKEPCDRDLLLDTDPRLIKKYAITKSPFKKSMTIPIVEKGDLGNDLLSEISDNDNDEQVVENLEKRHVLFKTAVSLVGSICGMVLIAMLMWKVMEEDLLGLLGFRFKSRPENENSLKERVKYLGGVILHILNTTMKQLFHLLTIPAGKVFGKTEPEAKWSSSFLANFMDND